jgi:hypothetical protein|tara:strand:- start:599 stop:961 length:363 start_codon:yes stop_codon:yes gene_type:complete
MRKFFHFLTLFSSLSTLLCCALPATLVAIGAGSVLASIVSNVPGFIWISQNKLGVFIFAGCMLTLGGIMHWRTKNLACPIDEKKANACQTGKRWSVYIYFFSLTLFFIGGFFAFVAPYLI